MSGGEWWKEEHSKPKPLRVLTVFETGPVPWPVHFPSFAAYFSKTLSQPM